MALDLRIKAGIAVVLGLIALAGLIYWMWGDEAAAVMDYVGSERIHPAVFIALFALLPIIGFPISPFVILIGIKFGSGWGLLIMAAVMPIHLIVAFLVANSFVRSAIERFLEKRNHRLPQIPTKRVGWFSFVFMAFPGLSYALKNYTLAMSGVPFRFFFFSGFVVQGAIGTPFLLAGEAVAGHNLYLLAAVFFLLVTVYGAVYLLRRRYRRS